MSSRSHWEHIYTTRAATSVSRYQPHAAPSLGPVRRIAEPPTAAHIDIGSWDPADQSITLDIANIGFRPAPKRAIASRFAVDSSRTRARSACHRFRASSSPSSGGAG